MGISYVSVMIFLPSPYVRIVTVREKEWCLPRPRYFYFMLIPYFPCEVPLGADALAAMTVFISLLVPHAYFNVDVVIVGVPMEVPHIGHPFEIIAHLRQVIYHKLGKLVLNGVLNLVRWHRMVPGELDVGVKLRILGEKTPVMSAALNLCLFSGDGGYRYAHGRVFAIIQLLIIYHYLFSLIIYY